jgi:hypothetical protein
MLGIAIFAELYANKDVKYLPIFLRNHINVVSPEKNY